jgi:hypothetical protein
MARKNPVMRRMSRAMNNQLDESLIMFYGHFPQRV